MKRIKSEEFKQILIEMLKYIDGVCQKYNINYTVTGGTAIGAIREKGFIPWDDDVDMGLVAEEYKKLKEALINENNSKYKLLYPGCNDSYYFPFMKLVDTRTKLEEDGVKPINDYGIYIDIFEYNVYPDSKIKQLIYKAKMSFNLKVLLKPKYYFRKDVKFLKLRKIISKTISLNKLQTKIRKNQEKFNGTESKKMIVNWPVYSYKKEIMDKSIFEKFIRVEFENISVMISKEYHNMLTNMYGDYMTPPQKKLRTSHKLKAYWKSN